MLEIRSTKVGVGRGTRTFFGFRATPQPPTPGFQMNEQRTDTRKERATLFPVNLPCLGLVQLNLIDRNRECRQWNERGGGLGDRADRLELTDELLWRRGEDHGTHRVVCSLDLRRENSGTRPRT